MSVRLKMREHVGGFAENKDVGRELRRTVIEPAIDSGAAVEMDFRDVAVATQSFIHALLSEAIRQAPDKALGLMSFKNCSPAVKSTITLVAEYTQDTVAASQVGEPVDSVVAGEARTSGKRRRRSRKK